MVHEVRPGFRCYVKAGRYANANGRAAAIVASISVPVDSEGAPLKAQGSGRWHGDWAAYWGGCDPHSEEEGVQWVARYGVKMAEADARHFFFRPGSWEHQTFGDLPYRK